MIFAQPDRTPATQASYQLYYTLVTLAVSLVGGFVTGKLASLNVCGKNAHFYQDENEWETAPRPVHADDDIVSVRKENVADISQEK